MQLGVLQGSAISKGNLGTKKSPLNALAHLGPGDTQMEHVAVSSLTPCGLLHQEAGCGSVRGTTWYPNR